MDWLRLQYSKLSQAKYIKVIYILVAVFVVVGLICVALLSRGGSRLQSDAQGIGSEQVAVRVVDMGNVYEARYIGTDEMLLYINNEVVADLGLDLSMVSHVPALGLPDSTAAAQDIADAVVINSTANILDYSVDLVRVSNYIKFLEEKGYVVVREAYTSDYIEIYAMNGAADKDIKRIIAQRTHALVGSVSNIELPAVMSYFSDSDEERGW